MNDAIAIKVEHVSKVFKLPHEKHTSIKGALINLAKNGRRNRTYERQQALKDISFEIKRGEFYGIVGRNGSGKSTLLKMLAGIYEPTEGKIKINGKLTPFIELGVGFNPELTGRENVFLNGALLGFNRKEMEELYDDIVEFAELEKFMDQKLKNYSSGMQVRLAFSIAIRAQSDILLLDEVLAVGDSIFQQKCYDYFKQLKHDKKTVVLVSHDASALQQYCDRGVLIDKGEFIFEGPIAETLSHYRSKLAEYEKNLDSSVEEGKERWGTQEAEVVSMNFGQKKKQPVFTDTDAELHISVSYKANASIEKPVFGITINDLQGQHLMASNTLWLNAENADMSNGEEIEITWKIPNVFNNGTYFVNPAVANSTGTVTYDWRDQFGSFKIRKSLISSGLINVDHTITASMKSNE